MDLQHFRCLLFDLDDTLYPQNNGVWEMIRVRINRYMTEVLGFSPEVVPPLRQRLWKCPVRIGHHQAFQRRNIGDCLLRVGGLHRHRVKSYGE